LKLTLIRPAKPWGGGPVPGAAVVVVGTGMNVCRGVGLGWMCAGDPCRGAYPCCPVFVPSWRQTRRRRWMTTWARPSLH